VVSRLESYPGGCGQTIYTALNCIIFLLLDGESRMQLRAYLQIVRRLAIGDCSQR